MRFVLMSTEKTNRSNLIVEVYVTLKDIPPFTANLEYAAIFDSQNEALNLATLLNLDNFEILEVGNRSKP